MNNDDKSADAGKHTDTVRTCGASAGTQTESESRVLAKP